MNFSSALLLVLAGIVLSAVVFLLLRRTHKGVDENVSERMMLQFQKEMNDLRSGLKDQVLDLSQRMNEHLERNSRFLNQSHQGYSQAVGQVQHRLGELQQVTQSMMEIGKDIASLQDILRAPKLRGGLGELFLAELLRQILPEDHFSLQYAFQDGSRVDAVIFLGQGMIPVDAKFPLENFKRMLAAQGEEDEHHARKHFQQDVRKHIDDIAAKYILPAEGTFEFALMYIPAENVYYETIIKDEVQPESLSGYAIKKKVIPVSPNSFYAYLQVIVRGLKGLRIERSAQLILESLGQLETDFKKCLADFEKIGDHIKNAQSAFDRTDKRLGRLQEKMNFIEMGQDKPLIPESLTDTAS